MRKVVVPNVFFEEAAEALRKGKSVKIYVDGQSMYPFIRGGMDLVEIIPYCPSEKLPLWCCLFYRWEGMYMIHRYVGKRNGRYRMMGDGNLYRMEEVAQNEIIGVLRYIYRADGSVQDCKEHGWLTRGVWWYRLRGIRRFLLPLFRIAFS